MVFRSVGRGFRASVACAVALLVSALLASGCSAQVVIGGEGDAAFQLTNGLGRGIVSVSVRDAGSEAFDAPLHQEGELGAGQVATVRFGVPAGSSVDVRLQTTGGMAYELHGVDLGAFDEATVESDGAVAYLTYVDAAGNQVSTLAAENAYRENAEREKQAALDAERKAKDAKAEAEAKAKEAEAEAEQPDDPEPAPEADEQAEGEQPGESEQPAPEPEASDQQEPQQEPAYQEPAYQEPVYEEPVYQEPVYQEPAPATPAPGGEDDACVDDLLLRG